MKKEALTTRQQFKLAYRRWRMYGESDDFIYIRYTGHNALVAAQYAYDARDYELSGWKNRRRYNEFHHLRAIKGYPEDLPF